MKLKILMLSFIAFFAIEKINAQQKAKFTTSYLAGLLTGASEPAFQLQAINGVRYKDFSAGIGVGMDNYYFKSIPVFLHITRKIFSKDRSPFVYTDFGINFPEDRSNTDVYWETKEYSKGMYFDLGFGYSIPLYKKLMMTFSLGYSQKQQDEHRSYKYLIDVLPRNYIEPPGEYYTYTFRRISLKAGLSF
jgi:hypothetical protein